MPDRGSLDALIWKALLIAGVLWLLYANVSLVVDTLIAVMVASAILPLADAAQKRRVPRVVTVLVVYIVGIGGLILLVSLLVPVVVAESQQLVQKAPAYREVIAGWIESARRFAGRWGGQTRITVPEVGLKEVGQVLQQLAERSLSATRGVFSGAISALLVLFVAAYIVVDRQRLSEGLLVFVPKRRRAETAHVASIVFERMGGYVRGQLTVSAAIALLLSTGLAVLSIDSPILLGATAGALNFVPFLGSTVALILALLVSLNKSLLAVAGVLLLFGGVSLLEGKVLVPYLLGRRLALHPLAVLAAFVIGAQIAGLIGAVVAVPITAGLNAIVREVYVRPMESA
jgi:predicted PurR-regulated permease PerM